MTEKALAQSFADQIGDIGEIIAWILAAVFFTLLLVAGNTMAQSVRERTNELAVLKTVGFTNGAVLGAGARRVVPARPRRRRPRAGAGGAGDRGRRPHRRLPAGLLLPRAETWSWGALFVVALGFVAGLLPAVQAMRLRIVDALRRV